MKTNRNVERDESIGKVPDLSTKDVRGKYQFVFEVSLIIIANKKRSDMLYDTE